MKRTMFLLIGLAIAASAAAQNRAEDEYTRYELLAPETSSFKITYDVTAVTPGAKFFFNAIHNTTQVSDLSAIDLMTGAPLVVKEVTGEQARAAGLKDAVAATHYLQVELARPVPDGGQARIRILKTYKDATGYHRDGDGVVFTRGLTVRRDAVVLPKSYEIVGGEHSRAGDRGSGRPDRGQLHEHLSRRRAAHLRVARAEAASGLRRGDADDPARRPPAPVVAADAPVPERPLNQVRVSERAIQDREIVYFLKQPETHAFSLYHDYTASREGEHQYVNVVRAGSSVSEPSAKILDTGEELKTRTLTGADVAREKIDIPDRVEPDTQLVLIPFGPVKKGQSFRLRISETYTDPARYALVDGQLMWHRSFGRPRNDMVLPAGWYLTTSSIPAVITQEPDGRIRLSFWNPRPDNVDVFVKARQR